jgi:hypothetical protein
MLHQLHHAFTSVDLFLAACAVIAIIGMVVLDAMDCIDN